MESDVWALIVIVVVVTIAPIGLLALRLRKQRRGGFPDDYSDIDPLNSMPHYRQERPVTSYRTDSLIVDPHDRGPVPVGKRRKPRAANPSQTDR
ncbi:hypothetical protein [Gordonia sp. (in: high G+C Gram-positive bacteria)]|uniref:hypothetical protein n=1 Tax=Gordonia sp. (in: high G+C Gram-positive bacteria) TaxID=84139 RepID=UPI0039E2D482